jgi:hypothetical protein
MDHYINKHLNNLLVMKILINGRYCQALLLIVLFSIYSCSSSVKKQSEQMNRIKKEYSKGSYGYDVSFFKERKIKIIELKSQDFKASVLLVPSYQGRVMTSSSNGNEGVSYGWINHDLITSGKIDKQFNPFGGEERLWLGPEGGPFSIYFNPDSEQIFKNWVVPKEFDTEQFEVITQNDQEVIFTKSFELTNASGTRMSIGIKRTVTLLSKEDIEKIIGQKLDKALNCVAYESKNVLINKGQNVWNTKDGVLSIWILSMFQPSERGIVFIPFKKGDEALLGKIVTDDYFGKVPKDRLIIRDGVIFFKTDGKYRSKIGVPPQRALPLCGSYDPDNSVLTLLWYSLPDKPSRYVNSIWGHQKDPLSGDVVNSYNDGPVADGSIMGPFYEIESSSPAALLAPNDSIIHAQRIIHISSSKDKLELITKALFDLTIKDIERIFN